MYVEFSVSVMRCGAVRFSCPAMQLVPLDLRSADGADVAIALLPRPSLSRPILSDPSCNG